MFAFERIESLNDKNNFLIHWLRPEYKYYHTVWHFIRQRYREIIDKKYRVTNNSKRIDAIKRLLLTLFRSNTRRIAIMMRRRSVVKKYTYTQKYIEFGTRYENPYIKISGIKS